MSYRLVLILLASTGALMASTISTQVSCGAIAGTSHCNTADSSGRTASATASVAVINGFDITVQALAQANAPLVSSASASYHAILAITAAGVGAGYIRPTLPAGFGTAGFATAQFVGATPVVAGAPCFGTAGCGNFEFGQINYFTLDLSSSVGGTPPGMSGLARFAGTFEFWDAQGTKLSNVQFSIADAEVPEPATSAAVTLAILAVAFARIPKRP